MAAASLTINSATTPTSVVGVIRAEARRIIGANQSDVSLQGADDPAPAGALTVPLIGRAGRPLGYIHLAEKATGPFTEDDEAILTQLAHMAAVAFDNARLYEELREADRRKDEFLATLAHELRNPLAPIRNALQVMRLASHDPAALERARAMIERQVAADGAAGGRPAGRVPHQPGQDRTAQGAGRTGGGRAAAPSRPAARSSSTPATN